MCADRIRVVLGFDANTQSYARLAVLFKWRLRHHKPRDGAQNLEWVMCTDDEANWIHHVEDHKIGVKYLLLIGPRAEEFEKAIRREVRNQPRRILLQRLREEDLSRKDHRLVLYQLAIDAVEQGFDQQVFDIYSQALADPDSFIRQAAVVGASYLGWPQLAEPLRPLATDAEKNEAIRRDAALLVRQLDTQGVR